MTQLTAPEQKLIELIRIGLNPTSQIDPAPITDVEWTEMVRLAEQHGVAAWLYIALKKNGWQARLPEQTVGLLRSAFLKRVVGFELHRLWQERVLRALANSDIQPIVLKGGTLAYSVYPDPICRGIGDLDLWVRENEMSRAQAVLEGMGYVWRDKPSRPIELQRRNRGEVQLFGAKITNVMIELHWSAFPGEWILRTARVDESGVRARARQIQLDKRSVLSLSLEDTVIQLAVHFAVSHQMGAPWLRALLDLALVFQTQSIDWNVVVGRARTWRLANVMYLVLQLTQDLMGQPDKEIIQRLAPALPRRVALAKMANLASVTQKRNLARGSSRFIFLLLLVDRVPDAIYLFVRALWPEPEWLLARYNQSGWRIQFRHLAGALSGRV